MKIVLAVLLVVGLTGVTVTAHAQEAPTTTVPTTEEPPSTTVPVPPPTTEVSPPTTESPVTTAPAPMTTEPPAPAPVAETVPLNSVHDVGRTLLPAEYRSTHSFSITSGNLNGDNRPDLVFGLHSRIRAYVNLPTGLELVLEHNGADSHGCDIGDVNADGRGDIYCVLGGGHGSRADKANLFFIQNSDGSFTNLSATWGAKDPYGRGRHVRFAHLDGDGRLDLFVGNEYPREDGRPSPNRTFRNTGSTFVPSSLGAAREVGGLCVERVDQNADGRDDILVCGGRGPATPGQPVSSHDRLHLYRQTGGVLQDVAPALGIAEPFVQGAAMARLDGNRSVDTVMVTKSRLMIDFGSHRTALPLTAGRAVAIGRFDGGPTLDVLVVQGASGGRNRVDYVLLGKADHPGQFVIRQLPNVAGSGDTAEAVDLNGDGRVEFVIGNGQWGALGPMQVLTTGTFAPAATVAPSESAPAGPAPPPSEVENH